MGPIDLDEQGVIGVPYGLFLIYILSIFRFQFC